MKSDRIIQILTEGLKAAHERMFSGGGAQRPEYPRDFGKLYGRSEDGLFELLGAIKLRDPFKVIVSAADVIVVMSEIIDYALTAESLGHPNKKKGGLT